MSTGSALPEGGHQQDAVPEPPRLGVAIVRPAVAGLLLVVGYFVVPINHDSDAKLAGFIAWTLLVLAFCAWEVRRFRRSDNPLAAALEMLVALGTFYVVSFATAYYLFSEYLGHSFSLQLTRVDALYFSLTVFTTTGFGDITPSAQPTRLAVATQMVSTFVLLGLGIRFLNMLIGARQRATNSEQHPPGGSG